MFVLFFTIFHSDCTNFEYYNDPKNYPVNCMVPFTINESWMFLAVFVVISTALNFIELMYLSIDSFMFGGIYIIGGQIELLNTSMNKIKNVLLNDDNFSQG